MDVRRVAPAVAQQMSNHIARHTHRFLEFKLSKKSREINYDRSSGPTIVQSLNPLMLSLEHKLHEHFFSKLN